GTTKGSTLSANNRIPVNVQQAVALVKVSCAKVRKLAHELADDELGERFVANRFVIRAGARKEYAPNDFTAEGIEMLCDTAFSILYESAAAVTVLGGAIYDLVGFSP